MLKQLYIQFISHISQLGKEELFSLMTSGKSTTLDILPRIRLI